MAKKNDKDRDPYGPIVNEILCFIVNKWGRIDIETLIKLCCNCNEKDIQEAKELLFELIHDENDTTRFKERRDGKGSKSEVKSAKNIRDICQLLEEKGDVDLPLFVALDLSKLPPITFESIDVIALLRKIEKLESTVDMLKEGMTKVTNASETLCNKSTCYDLSPSLDHNFAYANVICS